MMIETRELGLAAYIKIKGARLVKFENGKFCFKSSKTIDEWRVDYLNSEAYRHDTELMELRKFMSR